MCMAEAWIALFPKKSHFVRNNNNDNNNNKDDNSNKD